MKQKTHQSKNKRTSTTKSGLLKRARVSQQHRRSSKSNRQKRAAKQTLAKIDRSDMKALIK